MYTIEKLRINFLETILKNIADLELGMATRPYYRACKANGIGHFRSMLEKISLGGDFWPKCPRVKVMRLAEALPLPNLRYQ
jgi:hypothetical protein